MKKLSNFIYKYRNKKILVFLDKLIYRFSEHNIISFSGSLVYFIILSVFPFIIALLNLLNFTNFINSDSITYLIKYLPPEISNVVMGFINEVSKNSSGELLSFSVILGFWSASRGIKQFIKNINMAYGFKEKRGYIKLSAISILFTIALMFMIIMLLLTQVFGKLIIEALIKYIGLTDEARKIWSALNNIIPLAYMIIIFALLYIYSPSADDRYRIRKKAIIPGSFFATFGTIIITKFFSFYVSHFANYSVTYGSLGGIIVILIWLWLMSMIILLGGEINAVTTYMITIKDNNYWPREESVMKKFIKNSDE